MGGGRPMPMFTLTRAVAGMGANITTTAARRTVRIFNIPASIDIVLFFGNMTVTSLPPSTDDSKFLWSDHKPLGDYMFSQCHCCICLISQTFSTVKAYN
jgi:hypothetical protein